MIFTFILFLDFSIDEFTNYSQKTVEENSSKKSESKNQKKFHQKIRRISQEDQISSKLRPLTPEMTSKETKIMYRSKSNYNLKPQISKLVNIQKSFKFLQFFF